MIFLRIDIQLQSACSLKSIKANHEWTTRSFVQSNFLLTEVEKILILYSC